jgi:hypothetical protein
MVVMKITIICFTDPEFHRRNNPLIGTLIWELDPIRRGMKNEKAMAQPENTKLTSSRCEQFLLL